MKFEVEVKNNMYLNKYLKPVDSAAVIKRWEFINEFSQLVNGGVENQDDVDLFSDSLME